MSIVTYTALRPFVIRSNDLGSDLGFLVPRKGARRSRKKGAAASDAVLGGGAGATA